MVGRISEPSTAVLIIILPETNVSAEEWWLGDDTVLFGGPFVTFQGRTVSLGESIIKMMSMIQRKTQDDETEISPQKQTSVLHKDHIFKSSWWFQPICKMLVKMGSSSPNRDEHKKSLKPPPRGFSQLRLTSGKTPEPRLSLKPPPSHIFKLL